MIDDDLHFFTIQTITGRILSMSILNDTIHSTLSLKQQIWVLKGPNVAVET